MAQIKKIFFLRLVIASQKDADRMLPYKLTEILFKRESAKAIQIPTYS